MLFIGCALNCTVCRTTDVVDDCFIDLVNWQPVM